MPTEGIDETVNPASVAGPWTAKDHAEQGSFDEPFAAALVSLFRPETGWGGVRVVDWGGGPGWYLDGLAEAGALTVLVEPLCPPDNPAHMWIERDMTRPVHIFPAHLVICVEVLEHLPRVDHDAAIDNVVQSLAPGGWLVFSGATPGQWGFGHIAERPEAQWRQELSVRGLVEDPDKTAAMRAVGTLHQTKFNVMAWRRRWPE